MPTPRTTENLLNPPWKATTRALELHREAVIFDSLSLDYVLEEPYTSRLLDGGVTATNVTFVVEEDWNEATRMIETALQRIDRSASMVLIRSAEDIENAKRVGKLGIIMGTQGASMIESEFWRLALLYRLGLRVIQLTYTASNLYGDGCGELRDAGLSILGREMIEAVNQHRMWLDLSHCGHRTTDEAIALARNPVITHANSYSVNATDRNKKDSTVKAVVAKGGMIGVAMPPRFIKGSGVATIEDLVDHVDHLVGLVGVEHVGTGFDFTEKLVESKTDLPAAVRWRRIRPDMFGTSEEFAARRNPDGLVSIVDAPNFTQALLNRGYSESDVCGIVGGNWLRTFRAAIG